MKEAEDVMNMSRREMIAGAAAAPAIAIYPKTVLADVAADRPEKPQQAPGIYRQEVGNILMTSITDGANSFPRKDDFVSNVHAAEVASTLEAAFLPTDMITLTFTPVVLETSGRVVVFDTGLGEAAFKSSKGVGGQFHTNLRAAGYDVRKVDQVVITHFHADHIGGLIAEDGTSAFPNSRILVPAAEYAFWMDDGNASRAKGDIVQANFQRARKFMTVLGDQVERYQPDMEVVPGVTSIATPGHTPGHSSFFVASHGHEAIIQGDATTHPALFVERPGWHSWSDMDPDLAELSRRRLYDRAAAGKVLIQGFHMNFPALGYVSKNGSDYRFVPVNWSAAL